MTSLTLCHITAYAHVLRVTDGGATPATVRQFQVQGKQFFRGDLGGEGGVARSCNE